MHNLFMHQEGTLCTQSGWYQEASKIGQGVKP